MGWFGRMGKAKVHVALVVASAGYAGNIVVTKASLSGGVDPFLFSTYRDGIGCLTLFLYASLFERKHWPKLTLEVAGFVLSVAIAGIYVQQTFLLFGLQFTNVIFSSIVMNCVPGWVILIAVIFRLEKISFHKRDGQAKVLGIMFCVAGATILTLYKGPIIFGDSTHLSPNPADSPASFSGLQAWGIDTWTLGAICLVACSLCVATSMNLQVPALKRFPAPFTFMALTTMVGTSMFAITTFFRVEASEWILPPGPHLFAAVYAGLVASGICLFLSAWSTHRSGPLVVAAYTPMQPIFATSFGFIFLHSALYMGTLLGATSVLTGLFLVIWGSRESLRLKALEIPTHEKQLSPDSTTATSLLVEPLLT